MRYYLLFIISMLLLGCNSKIDTPNTQDVTEGEEPLDTICSCPQCVIKLLPYDDYTKKEAMRLLPKLQKAFDEWLYGAWKFEIMDPMPPIRSIEST